MAETFTCDHCGQELTADRQIEFDRQTLCEDCFEELTTTCDRCGDRIWRDNSTGDSEPCFVKIALTSIIIAAPTADG